MNIPAMRGVLMLAGALGASPVHAEEACADTAALLRDACVSQAEADHGIGRAVCRNLRGDAAQEDCRAAVSQAHDKAVQLCAEQRDWRLASCPVLGAGRYDPKIDPSRFDTDFRHLKHPNPYFPLDIGDRWVYQGGDELNTVEVVDETKLIEGVTAIVFRDLVYLKGRLHEATDDWFGAAKDGTVWYFGEEVKNYRTFKGDQPRSPELITNEGSFKHGRGGDKAGVIMLAAPAVGQAYREEFALATAEDAAQVLATDYAWGRGGELDESVPQALAERMCAAGDCLVTKNWSLLEPGVVTRKYYARGLGVFLETIAGGGIDVQLTDCNFDVRCVDLPPPVRR